MVYGEGGWPPVSPSVRNLPPEAGYPAPRRVKVDFVECPPGHSGCGEAVSETVRADDGLCIVRLGRRPGSVLRTLHGQGDI